MTGRENHLNEEKPPNARSWLIFSREN